MYIESIIAECPILTGVSLCLCKGDYLYAYLGIYCSKKLFIFTGRKIAPKSDCLSLFEKTEFVNGISRRNGSLFINYFLGNSTDFFGHSNSKVLFFISHLFLGLIFRIISKCPPKLLLLGVD